MVKVTLLTKEQALNLQYGHYISDIDGNMYKINGKPQITKRTGEWRIPIKYGFNGPYGYIDSSNLKVFINPSSMEYPFSIRYTKQERQRNKARQIRYAGKIYKVKF
jgi:hypothetical protein